MVVEPIARAWSALQVARVQVDEVVKSAKKKRKELLNRQRLAQRRPFRLSTSYVAPTSKALGYGGTVTARVQSWCHRCPLPAGGYGRRQFRLLLLLIFAKNRTFVPRILIQHFFGRAGC